MKIKINRNIDVDVEKARIDEIWPRYLYRNDVLNVDKIESLSDNSANLVLDDGDVVLNVPNDVYSIYR